MHSQGSKKQNNHTLNGKSAAINYTICIQTFNRLEDIINLSFTWINFCVFRSNMLIVIMVNISLENNNNLVEITVVLSIDAVLHNGMCQHSILYLFITSNSIHVENNYILVQTDSLATI
jgi:hypothetical protein